MYTPPRRPAQSIAGCPELRPLLEERQSSPGVYIATGTRALPSWFLSALVPALADGMRVFWIDAGNDFDAYGVSRTARTHGLREREVLSRIRLARPFNAFQLETLLTRQLPAQWRGEPVVLSNPLSPLLDEETPVKEVKRVLPAILRAIQDLPAAWLTLCVNKKEVPKERLSLVRDFLNRGSAFAWLDEETQPWHLRYGARPQLESART